MPGRELYEFRHPDPTAVVEPAAIYDAFRVVYNNPQTPDLHLAAGTVAATLTLLDMQQVKQVWGIQGGYTYLVA